MTLHASVIVIGDEILEGYVRDTNSGWLCDRLRGLGVIVDRVSTVADGEAAIDEALQAELARARPRLIVTSGGLGSTPDDITFASLAASLGRELVRHPGLVILVDRAIEWTRSMGVVVDEDDTAHMMRMAHVPEGATLLDRAGTFIPGVRVDIDGGLSVDDGVTLVILPGVPDHFRRILDGEVLPDLVAGRNPVPHMVEVTHTFPESALNSCMVRINRDHPDVRIGSYPGTPSLLRLSGDHDEVETAAATARDHIQSLSDDPAGQRLTEAWTRQFSHTPHTKDVSGGG